MRIAIIGAVVKPMVILVRPMKGSETWKESGCMTKIAERKNNTKVAMAKPLMLDIVSFHTPLTPVKIDYLYKLGVMSGEPKLSNAD